MEDLPLPDEIVDRVVDFLDPPALSRLSQTNKTLASRTQHRRLKHLDIRRRLVEALSIVPLNLFYDIVYEELIKYVEKYPFRLRPGNPIDGVSVPRWIEDGTAENYTVGVPPDQQQVVTNEVEIYYSIDERDNLILFNLDIGRSSYEFALPDSTDEALAALGITIDALRGMSAADFLRCVHSHNIHINAGIVTIGADLNAPATQKFINEFPINVTKRIARNSFVDLSAF